MMQKATDMRYIVVRPLGDGDWDAEMRAWAESIDRMMDTAEFLKAQGRSWMYSIEDLKGMTGLVCDIGREAVTLNSRVDGFMDERVPHEKGLPWYW